MYSGRGAKLFAAICDLRLISQVALTGLMALLPCSAWSAATPQKSKVLSIQVLDSAQADLEVLQQVATRAGMKCSPVLSVTQGHHPPPPLPEVQCILAGVPGYFEATAAVAPNKLLIQIYSSTESAPHGEVDPAIDRILERFQRALVQARSADHIEECFAPDLAPCFVNAAP